MYKILTINTSRSQKGSTQLLIDRLTTTLKCSIPNIAIETITPFSYTLLPSQTPENSFLGLEDNLGDSKTDDRDLLVDKIDSCDLLILASPTYFSNVTADMKLLIDRCCHLAHLFYFAGKPVVLASTSDGRGHMQVIDYLRSFVTGLGMIVLGELYDSGISKAPQESIEQVSNAIVSFFATHAVPKPSIESEIAFSYWKRVIVTRDDQNHEKRYWMSSGLLDASSFANYLSNKSANGNES